MRAGTIAVPQRTVARTWAALPQLLRFFVIGGVSTVCGYGAYALLLCVGLLLVPTALVSYALMLRFVFGGARAAD